MGPLNRHFTENTVPITKINTLILFINIISVDCENHTQHIYILCEQNAEIFKIRVYGSYVLENMLKKVQSNPGTCNSTSFFHHDTYLTAKNVIHLC
jgi:hypothetical protein